MILIEIGYGELFDKISILEIKKEKLKNSNDLKKVTFELSLLNQALENTNIDYKNAQNLVKNLKEINLQLWDIEDKIRNKERDNQFDSEFIELARNVYKTNDQRSRIKSEINVVLKSKVFEVKSYEKY